VQLPDDVIGRLRTGDLLLASDQHQPVRELKDVRGPQWLKLGMVVRASDFGVSLRHQDDEVLVYSPEEGELCAVADLVGRLPEETGEVVVCELDPGSMGEAVEGIAGRVGAETLRTDPLGDQFRDALRRIQTTHIVGALPGWERYRSAEPLAPRTCRYDGNPRPCPVHD
jgi:hypothetical protein